MTLLATLKHLGFSGYRWLPMHELFMSYKKYCENIYAPLKIKTVVLLLVVLSIYELMSFSQWVVQYINLTKLSLMFDIESCLKVLDKFIFNGEIDFDKRLLFPTMISNFTFK